jgi:hypothetical protein
MSGMGCFTWIVDWLFKCVGYVSFGLLFDWLSIMAFMHARAEPQDLTQFMKGCTMLQPYCTKKTRA